MCILALLCITELKAQINLTFNKRFVESEDKWVAFKPDKDSSYPFGFIYIDAQAGLTLNFEGSFKILSDGRFVAKKSDNTNTKIRLEPNNVLVAFIPENKFQELQISLIPDWLTYYKTDTNSVERLYRWGYMYNGWGECAKALSFLEKAKTINSKHKGLMVELSYSYNCLEQYDKAEMLLDEEIKINPGDSYTNKEFIYTLTKNNKIAKATIQFEALLTTVKDKQYHAENCYNILQYYYKQKDKENFAKWYKILQLQPNLSKMIIQYSDNMKRELEK
ncbi:tetratricopeptide repeat protein [Sediminibacterium goheungense]|nr:hypothetical protein [Sediminibacterium goheungense]